jgi:tetratricopeptide (TPR) repeat protein
MVVGDIPQEPPGFQLRADLLTDLDRAGPGVSVVHAVTGMRGVGKTQLAAAYARAKLAEGWRLVAWVNAEDPASLAAGLAAVAEAAGLAGNATGNAGLAVRHLLEADGDRRLLVFDDAADADALRPYIPAGGAARVLITSNRRSVANLGTGVGVEVFTKDEAAAFLADRTGLADAAGAGAVAAVLSAAGVRRDLLQAAGQAGALGRRRRRARVTVAAVDAAVGRLAERSLLGFSLDGQTIVAHRLVLRVVRDTLAGQGRVAAVCRAAATVLNARSAALAGSQDRLAVRDIPEQVTALLDHAAGPAVAADDDLARLLLRLRFWALYHLNALGDSTAQAILLGEPLTVDMERVPGPDHPITLTSRNNLANAYRAAGRAAEALELHEQVLAGRERVLGPDHRDTLQSRSNLAAAYATAGRAAEVIPLFEQAVADRERVLGADHPDTLASRNNLAVAYEDAGRTAEAIRLHEQVLADRERILGPDHPDTLQSRYNLARVSRQRGHAS